MALEKFLIGNAVGLLSLLIAVLAAWWALAAVRKNRFIFSITEQTEVISVKSAVQGDVHVLFKSHAVRALWVTVIEIGYKGRHAVRKEDFIDPLRIKLGSDVRVLDAEVVLRLPSNIDIDIINYADNEVFISRALMNPGDEFILKVLSDAVSEPRVEVIGRIANVAKITEAGRRLNREGLELIAMFVGIVVSYFFIKDDQSDFLKSATLMVFLYAAAIICVYTRFYPIWKNYSRSKLIARSKEAKK